MHPYQKIYGAEDVGNVVSFSGTYRNQQIQGTAMLTREAQLGAKGWTIRVDGAQGEGTYGEGNMPQQVFQVILPYEVSNNSPTLVGEDTLAEKSIETDDEIATRIAQRFRAQYKLVLGAAAGHSCGLILSGPPGLGKSYGVNAALEAAGVEADTVKGHVSPVGLYRVLWDNREGGVVVFDDCDSVLRDEKCLNLLKAALDSTDKRIISWNTSSEITDDAGDIIPTSFEFSGTVIFITNLDFQARARQDKGMGVHLSALSSRTLYLNLTIRTLRERMIRIRQVVEQGFLDEYRLSQEEADQLLNYLSDKSKSMYLDDLNLRTLKKLAGLYTMERRTSQMTGDANEWKSLAEITLFDHS